MRKVPKSILLHTFPCAERPYKGEKRNGKSLLELGRALFKLREGDKSSVKWLHVSSIVSYRLAS